MKIKRFFAQIKHVLKWLPVIWQDRDFDYDYLLEIMHFKLKNMHKFFASNDPVVIDAPQVALELAQVIEVLERYFDNDYCHDEFAAFNAAMGITDNDSFEELSGKLAGSHDAHIVIINDAEKLRRQDLHTFFDYIKNNLEDWWD